MDNIDIQVVLTSADRAVREQIMRGDILAFETLCLVSSFYMFRFVYK